jgi:hypothetical protein
LKGKNQFWRGSVEHLPTGQRVYLKNYREVEDAITSFFPEAEKIETEVNYNKLSV